MIQSIRYRHYGVLYPQGSKDYNIASERNKDIMISEEKVALMTKLALYEEKEGKKAIPLGKYYKEDYVSLHMLNTVIIATFSYVLILAVLIFAHIEEMMSMIATMDYVQAGKDILIGYVIMLLAYIVISYIVYTIKFKRIRKSLNEYNGNLKKLYNMYNEQN